MKKYTLVLVSLVLVLATLACSLPFVKQSAEPTPAAAAETSGEATPPAGTAIYAANGVEIALPESYELKDVSSMVSGDETFQQFYQQFADDIVLLALNVDAAAASQEGVLVIKNETFASVPLGLLSTVAGSFLGDAVNIQTQDQLSLGGRDTLRLQADVNVEGGSTTPVIYAFKDSGKLWLVGFLTGDAQLSDRLPTFDAAVASFTVVNVE